MHFQVEVGSYTPPTHKTPIQTLDNDILQDEHSDLDTMAPFTSTLIPLNQNCFAYKISWRIECSAAILFMIDDTTILENTQRKAHIIHPAIKIFYLQEGRRATHPYDFDEGSVRVLKKNESHGTSNPW